MINLPDPKCPPVQVSIRDIEYGKPFRLGPDSNCRIYYLGKRAGVVFRCFYVRDLFLRDTFIPDDAFVFPL